MKKNLSALDLHYLCKEFNRLLRDAKVDKVYHDDNKLLLSLHVPNKGPTNLMIQLPGFMFIKNSRKSFPSPSNFCIGMRKNLGGHRLRCVEQVGFERIVRMDFESSHGFKHIFIELYPPGNVLLTDEQNKIMLGMIYKRFSKRTIRPGIIYEPPARDTDIRTASSEEIAEILRESDRQTVVKAAAIDLGLGGTYAEEACSQADVDKDAQKLDDEGYASLADNVKKLLDKRIKPCIYPEKDVTPYPLTTKLEPKTGFGTFSEAIEEYLSSYLKEVKPSPFEKEKAKLETIIKKQEQEIKDLEDKADDSLAKAEKIYEKYALVQEIITEIGKARHEHTWKEIKEKLAGHKIIKEINPKDKTLLVEL